MKKPPLYSRSRKNDEEGAGPPIPSAATAAAPCPNSSESEENGDLCNIDPLLSSSENNDSGKNDNASSVEALLKNAQLFSMFTVRHIEEARQELLLTADSRFLMMNGNTSAENGEKNNFGGVNQVELVTAFEQLTSAYDKLSMLKWDAVRREYEATCRVNLQSEEAQSSSGGGNWKTNGGVQKQKSRNTAGTMANLSLPDALLEAYAAEGNPWQNGGDFASSDWIAAAFSNGFDSKKFTSPNNMGTAWGNASPPPGFGITREDDEDPDDTEGQVPDIDDFAHHSNNSDGKENTESTSIPSEISSLHTSSHIRSEGSSSTNQESDSDSGMSSDSSLSLRPSTPPLENFDYIYKGGYATRVSNGKEILGVVPRTAKHVLVDSTVTNIEDGAFQGCKALQSVTIASSVESIGDNAFRKCSQLKSVVFLSNTSKSRPMGGKKSQWQGEEKKTDKQTRRYSSRGSHSATSSTSAWRSSQLRSIGEWAFFNCSSLKALLLPGRIESIGERAFQRCSALSIMELPQSLTCIGENAFNGCPRETKLAFERWERASIRD